MIPRVRTWRCKLWSNGRCIAVEDIETINKRFARWEAQDRFLPIVGARAYVAADKITVALWNK